MRDTIKVLHITSHLGGGVGRCLSKLATYNKAQGFVEDIFLCLERPQDERYLDDMLLNGIKVGVAPAFEQVCAAIERADIVQLDWWHHPVMAGLLADLSNVPARWAVWAHVSGLHYPAIPPAFAEAPAAFMATTPITLNQLGGNGNRRRCIHSVGGFDDVPPPVAHDRRPHVGYLGAFHPAKLHPAFASYPEAVRHPDFVVDMYGDSTVNPSFERAVSGHRAIRLHGFAKKPEDVLPDFDIFVYLLNPLHYGSTENALLEAMAAGAVPVVLDNPVETGIVEHGVTGFVVNSPVAFAHAVETLLDDPRKRQEMGFAAAKAVRNSYSVERSSLELHEIYRFLGTTSKKVIDFREVFGETPAKMFLSCLGNYADCFMPGNEEFMRERRIGLDFLYEKTKSSAEHFYRTYPYDPQLKAWVQMLARDRVRH